MLLAGKQSLEAVRGLMQAQQRHPQMPLDAAEMALVTSRRCPRRYRRPVRCQSVPEGLSVAASPGRRFLNRRSKTLTKATLGDPNKCWLLVHSRADSIRVGQ